MSRSGYSDDGNFAMWRGQVASALRGQRGQAFLRELIAALDALPAKKLCAHELQQDDGSVCALGSVGLKRGIEMGALDPYDYDTLAGTFGVAHQLIQEIEYINDEEGQWSREDTPEKRWQRVRNWAEKNIKS